MTVVFSHFLSLISIKITLKTLNCLIISILVIFCKDFPYFIRFIPILYTN